MSKILTRRSISTHVGWILLGITVSLSGCDRLNNYSDTEHVQRAKELQDKHNTQAAVIELKNALQKNPKNAEARWMLGDIYATSGFGKEAEKELRLAGELGINRESLLAPLGLALLQQREFERILKEIEPSSNSSKINTAKILVIRGQAQISLGKLEEGCAAINDAIRLDANYVQAYIGMARCESLRGHSDLAKAEIDKAVKIDPNNYEAWAARGALETTNRQFVEAENAYTKSLNSKADNLEALLGRAAARIQLNKLEDADKDINATLKIFKDHPGARHLQGVLLYKRGKYAEAKTAFENALKTFPEYLPSTLWLGFSNFALANYEQANIQLSEFSRRVPNSTEVQALLALTQVKLGTRKDAESILAKLRNININDPQTLTVLGQAHLLLGDGEGATTYYGRLVTNKPESVDLRLSYANVLWQEGNKPLAIEQMEKAARLEGPKGNQAETLLILTLISDKQFDKALSVIAALEKKHPTDVNVFNLKGAALLEKGDLAAARKSLDRAAELSPNSAATILNLAQLDIVEKKPQDARERMKKYIDKNPRNTDVLLSLASLAAKEGKESESLDWLEKAKKAAPEAARPRQLMVSYYLAKNNAKAALAVAEEGQAAMGGSPDALDLLGTAQLAVGEKENALLTFKKLAALSPKSPVVHYKLAMAEQAVQNPTGAKVALDKALALKPDYLEALSALFSLDIEAGRLSDAMAIAKNVQKFYPVSPLGQIFEGDVALLQKQYAASIAAYEKALHFQQSGLVVKKLHQALMLAGNPKEADKRLTDWLTAHPQDVVVREHLAGTYFVMGKNKEAIEQYRLVLNATPQNINALNNLAILYDKEGNAQSVRLAEEAYKQVSQSQMKPIERAAIADTLGWLLLKQGNIEKAQDILQKAAIDAPANPEIRYHLAAALAKKGDKTTARRELEALLSGDTRFVGIEDAKKLLQELK